MGFNGSEASPEVAALNQGRNLGHQLRHRKSWVHSVEELCKSIRPMRYQVYSSRSAERRARRKLKGYECMTREMVGSRQ